MFSIRDTIVLAALLVSVPICFVRPVYGVAAWTIMAFANPQNFGWGSVFQWQPAALIAVPTILGCLFFARNWSGLRNREVVLLVSLWVWFTLTTLNSMDDPSFADKAATAWYHWNTVSKIILMAAVSIAVSDNWRRLRWLVLAIAGSFGWLVLKNLPVMILTNGASRIYGPDHSMIADNNDFGLALNMTLPIFFFLAKTEPDKRMRRLMGFLFLATIPAILFTYSRGDLVGLIAVLGSMVLLSKRKMALIPVLLVALAFGALFTPQAWQDRMSLTESDKLLDASALSRLNAWTYAWRLACDYPILGGGFEAFTPRLFARYAPNAQDVHGPHSIYFGVMAEHGFVGLALYLMLVVSCFASLRRLAKTARAMDTPHIAGYANMLSLSLVGFLTSGTFLGRAYFDFFFTIVACVAILKHVSHAEWAQGTEESEPEPEDTEQPVISYGGPDPSIRNLQRQPAP